MTIASFERSATIAEMAVEIDRRGAVIDSLEAELSLLHAAAAERAKADEVVAWRDVDGFEGCYEVSNTGDLRSKETGRLLSKKSLAGQGYVKADLWKNNIRTQTYMHRLVAKAFVPGSGAEVNHKNGIKTDNTANNLEWCSRSENQNHSYYVLGNVVTSVVATSVKDGSEIVYRSICEAERDGFDSAHIYRAMKKPGVKVHKGCTWRSHTPPDMRQVVEALEKIAGMSKDMEHDLFSATQVAKAALAAISGEQP